MYHTPNDLSKYVSKELVSHVTRACIAAVADTAGSTVTTCSTVSLRPVKCEIAGFCPKCGKFKNSGTRSCCAPGGAWVNKCGEDGTSKDHTWFDGMEACKSTLMMVFNALD